MQLVDNNHWVVVALVLDWEGHPARGECGTRKVAVPKQVGASVVCGVPRSVCGVQLWTS